MAYTKNLSQTTSSGTSLSFNKEKSSIYFFKPFHSDCWSTPFCVSTFSFFAIFPHIIAFKTNNMIGTIKIISPVNTIATALIV